MYDLPDKFEIMAHPRNAGPARERIRGEAMRAGFADMDLADIEIAVGEAITNAILYGSPTAASRIILSCGPLETFFVVQIRDEGVGFDPNMVHMQENTDALGGRGIGLMRALMDRIELQHDGRGMVARLIKKLPLKPTVY